MYDHFLQKHPDHKCSYDFYRKLLRKMNIYFRKLGHEECELCETFLLHNDAHTKDKLDTLNCKTCEIYEVHHEKYLAARIKYETHSKSKKNTNELFVSADLQKVIMLPHIDNFKAAIFTKRIIVFNESFVPLGPRSEIKPFATLWHDGISGRKQEDLVSCFYEFLLFNKNTDKVTIWMDNCSAQNKNWCLMAFLVYISNSEEILTNEINLHYFQPGHSFMSADHFHHQVELSMKRMDKIYDFDDFLKCVKDANSSHTYTKTMEIHNFLDWKSESST